MNQAPTMPSHVDLETRAAILSGGRSWLRPALILLAVSLIGLAIAIATELGEGERFAFDPWILLALRVPFHPDQPIGPAWLLQSALDISALGGFTVMTLFGLAGVTLLLARGRRAEAIWIAAVLIFTTLANLAFKSWWHRPRPELVPHLARVASASFPSGHAMVSASVYLTLAIMLGEGMPTQRRYYVLFAIVLVVLIGSSRVFLGVHWPSDVLVGWSLGVVISLAAFAAKRRLTKARLAR